MLKLRYNNVKWTFPNINENGILDKTLNDFFTDFYDQETPFEAFYNDMIFSVFFDEKDIDYLYKDLLKDYKLQFLFTDENFDVDLIQRENFQKLLSLLEKLKPAFVFSNEILYDFLKNKYNNFTLIASEDKIKVKPDITSEIDFYEDLKNRYDRIILNPEYVKNKFFKEYKYYSDISKFEVFVDYYSDTGSNTTDNFKYFLTKDEIKFLIEEIGIKFLRFSNYGKNNILKIIEKIFEYVYICDAKSLYIFTEMLNKNVKEKFFYGI